MSFRFYPILAEFLLVFCWFQPHLFWFYIILLYPTSVGFIVLSILLLVSIILVVNCLASDDEGSELRASREWLSRWGSEP